MAKKSRADSAGAKAPRWRRLLSPPSLPPEKGEEIGGLLLLGLGLLLAVAFLTHDPSDPSLLHEVSGPPPPRHNWIGPVGAELSAAAFGLLGLTTLLVPALLLLGAWRRLRRRGGDRPAGRGAGGLLLLGALPALLQLALGSLTWRGGELAAGGLFGRLVGEALEARLNTPGAFLVLTLLVVIGAALLVQSTLGETLKRWGQWLRGSWQRLSLATSRRREQRAKEEVRRRVAERARGAQRQRQGGTGPTVVTRQAAAAEAPALDLPLKVTERKGEGSFAIRRVPLPAAAVDAEVEPAPAPVAAAAPPPAAAAPSHPARSAPAKAPQPPLPFPDPPARGGLPPVNLLTLDNPADAFDPDELVRLGEVIRRRCEEFGVEGTVEGITPGPVITVYEFQPAPGVKVSQIVNLQDDLALALKAESVRIERLPGRSTLGIEVPNRQRQVLHLGALLDKRAFRRAASPLTVTLGVDIHGEPYYADLATMPHLLVAGATGSGKSVGLQSMITSILYRATSEQVRFIFIDPKRIELGIYADIPSLECPVVVEPQQAANVLGHMVSEMEERYRLLAKVHVRSIAHYNQAIRDPEQRRRLAVSDSESDSGLDELAPLPYFVIIIDELADLMMVASSDVEAAIARLAQMARAVGIHLIVATQRPSVDVLTGTIKANFPCRVAYATATRHDSRTILDQVGAEKLLGKGDMLFMPPGTSRVIRLHGAYVSEQETAGLVRWLKRQGKPDYNMDLLEPVDGGGRSGGDAGDADDELYDEAARLVVAEQMGSASFLQRRMRVGFSRASRLIDMMERDGLLGPPQGSKPREVLVPIDYFLEVDLARSEP